ncbi:DUF6538 domain-containing protein [Leisingera aquimarina]|uniref:DUF6538 domain-containing protein n=1 Tax=Leisingera aquimarina TaxID=476529 RepID=UPI003CCBFB9B
MIATENTCIDGVERRGRVYYMRFRVPVKFAEVETRREINQTLGTQDYDEAMARFALKKRAFKRTGKPGCRAEAYWRGIRCVRAWQQERPGDRRRAG